LQCVAACCSVCCNYRSHPHDNRPTRHPQSQCVAVGCSMLQRVAVCVVTIGAILMTIAQLVIHKVSVLQCDLQCVAVCCSVLQHVAVHCSVLQRVLQLSEPSS